MSMNKVPLIKLENVWKVHQLGEIELAVLKGIDLEIAPGSFITIIGPSGSGKSTFLYIIGCLDVPSRGKVFLDGEDVSEFSQDSLAQIRSQKFGFVFQQFNLLSNLSALENVMIPMIFRGIPEQERKNRAENLLSSLGLEERVSHRPSELSGGEQQRVAIARALSNNPEIILADEPTGNLDSVTGKHILEILTDLHQKEKKTVIVITHDPDIANYSKGIISIKDGQITNNQLSKKEVLWKK